MTTRQAAADAALLLKAIQLLADPQRFAAALAVARALRADVLTVPDDLPRAAMRPTTNGANQNHA